MATMRNGLDELSAEDHSDCDVDDVPLSQLRNFKILTDATPVSVRPSHLVTPLVTNVR